MAGTLGVVSAVQPFHDIEIARTVQGNCVSVKEIRHKYEVAIRSELIGDELSIVETMTDHVGNSIGYLCQ